MHAKATMEGSKVMSMSLRLSEEAVQSVGSYSISEDAISALRAGDATALLRSHQGRWANLEMMARDDDDDNDDDDPDDEDDDDEDDEDSDDDDDEDQDDDDEDEDSPEGKKSKRKKQDPEDETFGAEGKKMPKDLDGAKKLIRAQQDTNDRLHRVAKKAQKQRDDALEELAKAKKDGVKDEDLREENSKLTKSNDSLTSKLERAQLQVAFLSDNTYEWVNPGQALRLVDLDEVEIGDDGKAVGLVSALQALAEDSPHLLKKNNTRKRTPAQRTGEPSNRRRSSKKATQKQREDEVAKKYNIKR